MRYCLACDLKDDPALIAEYEAHHAHGQVWSEITASIREAGIRDMEIYRIGNRMFMIMEVDASFDFEKKARMDARNPKVQAWEALMWKFQQSLPWARTGEKWSLMKQIFKLDEVQNQ